MIFSFHDCSQVKVVHKIPSLDNQLVTHSKQESQNISVKEGSLFILFIPLKSHKP
jgi:hypothetical protein